MSGQDIRYFILFEDYTHGMALHELMLADGVPHRIVPAPRSLQGEVSCGMALMVKPCDIKAARACIERHQAVHHSIAALAGQIKPLRDRYC
jgi:hypothetical protein